MYLCVHACGMCYLNTSITTTTTTVADAAFLVALSAYAALVKNSIELTEQKVKAYVLFLKVIIALRTTSCIPHLVICMPEGYVC